MSAIVMVATAAFGCTVVARADSRPTVVVPLLGIPAGTIITGSMVEERQSVGLSDGRRETVASTSDVVGRIARQWLPAETTISRLDLRSVPIVRVGAFVDIVFEAHGVFLTAQGLVLEPGGIGDTIRVRNVRSGVIVGGRVLGAARVAVDAP